jgi:pimeloyl-ACP methyl ester carboxylesterase
MAEVQTRCGGIAFSEQGTGFPLVLLHGSLCDRRDFDPIIPALAGRYRVIAVDWPWHGESDCPPPPLKAGAGLFAGVLEDFTQALALGPAAFIGSSVGGLPRRGSLSPTPSASPGWFWSTAVASSR